MAHTKFDILDAWERLESSLKSHVSPSLQGDVNLIKSIVMEQVGVISAVDATTPPPPPVDGGDKPPNS